MSAFLFRINRCSCILLELVWRQSMPLPKSFCRLLWFQFSRPLLRRIDIRPLSIKSFLMHLFSGKICDRVCRMPRPSATRGGTQCRTPDRSPPAPQHGIYLSKHKNWIVEMKAVCQSTKWIVDMKSVRPNTRSVRNTKSLCRNITHEIDLPKNETVPTS